MSERNALEEGRALFQEAGLSFPPITEDLAARLRRPTKWCFSTREVDEAAMYFFERYPVDALMTEPEPYFAVSHGGHGANSYALSYHLAVPGLTLVTQYGWGGSYMDNEAVARQISDTFERIAELLTRVDSTAVGPGGRLVVIESDIRLIGAWGRIATPLDQDGAERFLQQGAASPVEDALASLADG